MSDLSSFNITGTNNAAKQVSVTYQNDLLTRLGGLLPHTSIVEFGGVQDGSTDAAAALDSATEYLPVSGSSYSPTVRLGAGTVYSASTIEPNAVFSLEGMSSGYINGGAAGLATTKLLVPVDTVGIRIRSSGTEGTGLSAGKVNAGGSTISGVHIEQASEGTNREAHGIHARGTPFLRDISLTNIAGDGVNITAAFDGGASTYGNANQWFIEKVSIHRAAGNGLRVGTADSNSGLCLGLYVHNAGRAGVLDQSYYANTYIAPQFNATGNNGVHHGGARWQLNVASSLNEEPGVSANWYKIADQASPDANFPAWSAVTTYYCTLPILATNPAVVITPYQENQRTLGHIPSGLVIGGNMGVTQSTPHMSGRAGFGVVCNMGVGHYRSTGGDANHPAYASIGEEEFTIVGSPSSVSADLHKRAYLWWHRVNGFDWLVSYENSEKDIVSRYANQVQWSISGKGTARTYGRSTAQEGIFSLHDYALVDPSDANNARIHGIRDAAPASGYHARGEIMWNVAPAAGGTVGWVCTTAGTPGTWKTFGAIAA